MGFSLGGTIGGITGAIINPIGAITGGLLNRGAKAGPSNPYSAPDLSYLKDTSKLDFLKNPAMYKSLLDGSAINNLNSDNLPVAATSQLAGIPGSIKTFGSTYKAPGYGNANAMYASLLDTTRGPSSVDAVRNELGTDQLNQTLAGIDQDTTNSVGSLKSDFADRGLGGPGMLSDIEGNSLAQAYAQGNKNKAAARTTLGNSELDLLKNRETQNIGALTAAAGATAGEDTQTNQIAATGAQSDVTGYNSALQDEIKQQIAEQDAAAGRTQQNRLSYANLLNSNVQDYNNLNSQSNDLYAQLLNGRDLGAAGINSTNYNTAVGQQYQYAQPSWLDSIMKNINIGVKV